MTIKESPILFSGPMVRAILDGRKTQTRRVVKCDHEIAALGSNRQWANGLASNDCFGRRITEDDIEQKIKQLDASGLQPFIGPNGNKFAMCCPHGKVGDMLWVRETFYVEPERYISPLADGIGGRFNEEIFYRADGVTLNGQNWKPSIFMPRWASRITLEITGVRVERLNDISEQDAEAEGVSKMDWEYDNGECCETNVEAFSNLWESINGKGSWDENPWVWVIEFKRIGANA